MGEPGDGERDRLARVFSHYRDNPRRQDAWDAGNPGNAAIRDELARATLSVLSEHDPGGAVVDAGCGSGWWLGSLSGGQGLATAWTAL